MSSIYSELSPCCRTFSYRWLRFMQILRVLHKVIGGQFLFSRISRYNKIFFISETVFVYIHRWWIWENLWFGPRDICLHNKCNKSFGGTCHKQVQMKLVFSICEVTFLWLTLLPRKLTCGFYHVVFVDQWCIQYYDKRHECSSPWIKRSFVWY